MSFAKTGKNGRKMSMREIDSPAPECLNCPNGLHQYGSVFTSDEVEDKFFCSLDVCDRQPRKEDGDE